MKIKYHDYLTKTFFTKQELLSFSWGSLIEDPPKEGCGILPAPPMLMFDRVTNIEKNNKGGIIIAEQDINLDDWFFQCHFRSDPVQPGCLGVDAVWQLIGFFGTLCGAKGYGRALGAKEIEFFGQIRPHNKLVRYEVTIKRYIKQESIGAYYTIGSANILVDEQLIYTIKDAKVGIFVGIQYNNYPHLSKNAVGGKN
jgi:3-hydroxyacyl-[acyl-carrier protein] dehydratase / trans-2-decenoyl-[acyl-carrier protein] isomerase